MPQRRDNAGTVSNSCMGMGMLFLCIYLFYIISLRGVLIFFVDAWCLMHDAWCMIHDALCMVHDAWCMMHRVPELPPKWIKQYELGRLDKNLVSKKVLQTDVTHSGGCRVAPQLKMNKDHQDKNVARTYVARTNVTMTGKQSKQKIHKLWKKSIIFLTILNLGKNWFPDTPLDRNWEKIDIYYFDIVAPPITLAKIVPKPYQTDKLGLFYSYIGHICTKS